MRKFFTLMLTFASISMAFVSCDKNDEPNNDGGSEISYIDHLLALPDGYSEDGDHIHYKDSVVDEDFGFNFVDVMSFTFTNDICTKAVNDAIFDTAEQAQRYYDYMINSEEIIFDDEELDLITVDGRLITIDLSFMFEGATRDEVKMAIRK